MNHHIGQRLSYDGHLCTVKWVGELAAWPGVEALGVEWDQPERGKHSGEYNGVQYFDVRHQGAGSFLKGTKSSDKAKSFYKAVFEKYVDDLEETPDVSVGKNKVVERVGMLKFHERQKHVDRLVDIAVPGLCVSSVGEAEFQLSACQRLDLSFNLIETLQVAFDIAKTIPSVSEVVLNGNRFSSAGRGLPSVLSIRALFLGDTLIGSALVQQAVAALPSLDTLGLFRNAWTDADYNCVAPHLHSIATIDLSENALETIPETGQFTVLNLSSNCIASIPKWQVPNTSTTELDLSSNRISWWTDIDNLCANYPGLRRLRLRGNPVCTDPNADIYVLGRFASVEALNGSRITSEERRDAELYFMTKVAKHEHPFDTTSVRWNQLCDVYGEPTVSQKANTSTIKSRLMSVSVQHETDRKNMPVLPNATVQKLRVMAAKKFGVDPFTVALYTAQDTPMNDVHLVSFYGLESGATLLLKPASE